MQSAVPPGFMDKAAMKIGVKALTITVNNTTAYDIFIAVSADPNAVKLMKLDVGVGKDNANLGLAFNYRRASPVEKRALKSNTTSVFNLQTGQSFVTMGRKASSGGYRILWEARVVNAGETLNILEKHMSTAVATVDKF